MQVYFDLPHLYYLPQYQPVVDELERRGVACRFVLYRDSETPLIRKLSRGLAHDRVADQDQAVDLYRERQPDWIVFGNGFPRVRDTGCASALLFHSSGTSVKGASLSGALAAVDVRFVAGPGRLPVYRERFPGQRMVTVGFAKLDPIFGPAGARPSIDLAALGLDPAKKTLLYAPTFYPSSIENMARDWPDLFADCNILIKGHDFSFSKRRYRHQRRRLERWGRHDNVALADPEAYSLLPFMASADLMITDASSAIYEFAALDKPVLICDFVRLRWNYRGIFRTRLARRLDATTKIYEDVGTHVPVFAALAAAVRRDLRDPGRLSLERRRISDQIIGPRDGRAAERIADFLVDGIEPPADAE